MRRFAKLLPILVIVCLLVGCGETSMQYFQFPKETGKVKLRSKARTRGKTVEIELRVQEAPGKCSFDQVYLRDGTGRHIYPYLIYVLEEWVKVKATYSWSKTRFVNNKMVFFCYLQKLFVVDRLQVSHL